MPIGERASPPFERLLSDVGRARASWDAGDRDKARAILKMVASIAYASSEVRNLKAPIPENSRPQHAAAGEAPLAPLPSTSKILRNNPKP